VQNPVPGINGSLVPDLTDFDPTFEQAASHSLKVGDHKIDAAKGSNGRVGEPSTDLYRAT
jgi:hypothetical protein